MTAFSRVIRRMLAARREARACRNPRGCAGVAGRNELLCGQCRDTQPAPACPSESR